MCLSQHIKPLLGSRWYDLGVELLGDDDDIAALNEIQCKYPSDVDACCTKMFQLWLGKRQMVSWSHLIESMRHPNVKLHELARKIELMVLHSGNFARNFKTHTLHMHSKSTHPLS